MLFQVLKKQGLNRYLLTIHEILTIIWQNKKNTPKNRIIFPEITYTFVHLVCQINARRPGHYFTLCSRKEPIESAGIKILTAAGLF